jgi:hypothetical protein
MKTTKTITKIYDWERLLSLALSDLCKKTGHPTFEGTSYLCGLDEKGFPFIRIQLPESEA